MHKLSAADELAEIRTEIARLKLRESQLRDHLLHAPQAELQGRWSRIVIAETRLSRFNPALLPQQIRTDPQYLETRTLRSVRCVPAVFTATVRPGWPIPRELTNIH